MLVNTSLLNLYGINMNVELYFTDSKIVLFLKNEIKPGFIKKRTDLQVQYQNMLMPFLIQIQLL